MKQEVRKCVREGGKRKDGLSKGERLTFFCSCRASYSSIFSSYVFFWSCSISSSASYSCGEGTETLPHSFTHSNSMCFDTTSDPLCSMYLTEAHHEKPTCCLCISSNARVKEFNPTHTHLIVKENSLVPRPHHILPVKQKRDREGEGGREGGS